MCIKSTLHFSSNFKENSSVYEDSSGLATTQRWPQRLPPLTDCISTCFILYSPHSLLLASLSYFSVLCSPWLCSLSFSCMPSVNTHQKSLVVRSNNTQNAIFIWCLNPIPKIRFSLSIPSNAALSVSFHHIYSWVLTLAWPTQMFIADTSDYWFLWP